MDNRYCCYTRMITFLQCKRAWSSGRQTAPCQHLCCSSLQALIPQHQPAHAHGSAMLTRLPELLYHICMATMHCRPIYGSWITGRRHTRGCPGAMPPGVACLSGSILSMQPRAKVLGHRELNAVLVVQMFIRGGDDKFTWEKPICCSRAFSEEGECRYRLASPLGVAAHSPAGSDPTHVCSHIRALRGGKFILGKQSAEPWKRPAH